MENEEIEELKEDLHKIKILFKSIDKRIKKIDINHKKEIKKLKKEIKTNKNKKGKLSGFAKPCKLSKELTNFLNINNESMKSRTEVNKMIHYYIKENKLQNSENKQYIDIDEKLNLLLKIPENEKLTYFTLPKYMNKHFIYE